MKDKNILQDIYTTVSYIASDIEVKKTDQSLKKVKDFEKEALKGIQSSFNRIHDKLFNLNSIMLTAILVLSRYPSDKPYFTIYEVILPMLNLIFLFSLEYYQMEIFRFEADYSNWDLSSQKNDKDKHKSKIRNQTLRSLGVIIFTAIILLYIVAKIVNYVPLKV